MIYRAPVDFFVDAESEYDAKLKLEEFLLRSATEYRINYGVMDYQVPYGYAIKEVSNP